MFAQTGALLRTGLALKVNQIKRAFESYLHDRTTQGKDIVSSYLMAVGLFIAAAIFLIAVCFVGVMALFRWLELSYGEFTAFGGIAALLLALTGICAAIGASSLKRKTAKFPSLGNRLMTAVKANPVKLSPGGSMSSVAKPDPIDAAKAAAVSVLAAAPRAPVHDRGGRARARPRAVRRQPKGAQVGLLVAATLAGWIIARQSMGSRKADL